MVNNPFSNDDDSGTVFRDVIMLALLGFIVIVVLLLPFIRPINPNHKDIYPPGNVIVEIRWDDELDTDVDLWVRAPGDVPVGYSNKGGKYFNLLRDDLGHTGDISEVNYENAFSRGIIPGEYIVNLHLYRNASLAHKINVIVIVSVKGNAGKSSVQLLSRKISLMYLGQELTVFRFKLTDTGKLIKGSVHDLPIGLRSGNFDAMPDMTVPVNPAPMEDSQ